MKSHASATGSRSGVDHALRLSAADHVGEEVVHLADLPAHRLRDHRVVEASFSAWIQRSTSRSPPRFFM